VPIPPGGDARLVARKACDVPVNAPERENAPDFTLRACSGREVRLTDLRSKKLVLVWASWYARRENLPVWESLYCKLGPKGLDIVTIAEDSEGIAAAGPHIEAAQTALIGPIHSVTEYRFANVQTAVWIDETGTIVRLDQGAYPEPRTIVSVDVGKAGYADALRDWVAPGAGSPHVRTPKQLTAALAPRTVDTEIADQEFRLGSYFDTPGDAAHDAPLGARHRIRARQREDARGGGEALSRLSRIDAHTMRK
jgi:hypothetical protein